MKTVKTDLRSRLTVSIIKTALSKLLEQKQLKEITVAELCKEAQINRGTFYNHFYDIYDVYESVEDDLYQQLTAQLDKSKFYAFGHEFYVWIITIVSQNEFFAKNVLYDKRGNEFIQRIMLYLKPKYISEFKENYPLAQDDDVDSILTVLTNGIISLIIKWFTNGKTLSVERLAEQIETFNNIICNGAIAELSRRGGAGL